MGYGWNGMDWMCIAAKRSATGLAWKDHGRSDPSGMHVGSASSPEELD